MGVSASAINKNRLITLKINNMSTDGEFEKTMEAHPKDAILKLNRAARRAIPDKPQPTNVVAKAHRNNRPMNKARKNNKLFLKLAEFEMSMMDKRR